MTKPTVHLLFSSRNDQAYAAILEGISRAFGPCEVREEATLESAAGEWGGASGKRLMILIQPEMAELQLAIKLSQEDGMARWPVVCLSDSIQSTGLDVIPAEDWHGQLLAQVFRGALQKHELIRENGRLRGDLLTIARRISHDLRTPLSGIFTTAELLKEILAEHSEEDAALTGSLFDSTQAVLKIIERVSQLVRASVDHPVKEPVDMGQVAWAARQGAERASMERGTQMEEAGDWPEVEGVPAWLEVIWGSLIINAVMHTGKGRIVKMGWRELSDEYEFFVKDDGPGVAAAKVPNLFYPFDQLHLTHSSKGLGLSIVHRLVTLQGGRCGYEPIVEGGSRFFFTLPKTQA
jgi:signal transduction histidine kinase